MFAMCLILFYLHNKIVLLASRLNAVLTVTVVTVTLLTSVKLEEQYRKEFSNAKEMSAWPILKHLLLQNIPTRPAIPLTGKTSNV